MEARVWPYGVVVEITGTPTVVKLRINKCWGGALEEEYQCHRAAFDAIKRPDTGAFDNVSVRVLSQARIRNCVREYS